MNKMYLAFTLESDATFGRGEGVAGLVDEEVEHDQYGMPYLRGRTLKGLLVEECANLLFALAKQNPDQIEDWETAAARLFGESGTTMVEMSIMRVGDARLPQDLRGTIEHAHYHHREEKRLSRLDILESLTDIRRQTSMNEETGRADDGSLRSMRVILRRTPFEAQLHFREEPKEIDLALLSACVLAFRRAGTGRNRGKGQLTASLLNKNREDVTKDFFARFEQEVR